MTVKKANRNQKVVSDEEKEKISQGAKKRVEKEAEDKLVIKNAEKVIFEKSKANLPSILSDKINEIEKSLQEELSDYNGLKSARIHQLISRQTYYSGNALIGYSAKELFIVFECYKVMVDKINQYTLFVPSLKNFCAFAGFSLNTFKNHLQSPDDEKRNIAQMIDDYISDVAMDSAKMRRTDASITQFEMKSVHGMVEANAPIQVQHTTMVNLDKIRERLNEIKGVVIEGEFSEKKD